MSRTQRQAFIDGLQRAKSSGAYDRLVIQHQNAMSGDPSTEWHRRPILLPVHRWFLGQLEAAMGGVAVPYWDWTTSRSLPAGLGGDGDPAANYRVTTGPFASWLVTIYDSTTGGFVTRQPAGLVRQVGVAASTLPTASQMTTVLATRPYDAAPWDPSAAGFRNAIEGFSMPDPGFHNGVHNWLGGDMSTGTSPSDPLFYLHHAQIDRIWAGWQRRWGTTNYVAPLGQGPNDAMPGTGGVTPSQMFPIPAYDVLP